MGKKALKRRKKEGVLKGCTTSLDPRTRRLLYRAIEAGIPYNRSCEMIGVNVRNFQFWLKKGKEDTPGNEIYVAFRRYIRRIEVRKEKELLAVIDKVARGNYKIREVEVSFDYDGNKTVKRKRREPKPEWKAAAWRLERKFPEEYALKESGLNKETSPEDIAREIKEASDRLFNSIPASDDNE